MDGGDGVLGRVEKTRVEKLFTGWIWMKYQNGGLLKNEEEVSYCQRKSMKKLLLELLPEMSKNLCLTS